MKINSIATNNNFGARVKADYQMSRIMEHNPLKKMKNKLENSGTNNVYELGHFVSKDGKNGVHDVLLNGEKFTEINQEAKDGLWGTAAKFLEESNKKETSILEKSNPEVAQKMNSIRDFIKTVGLAIEDVKNLL